MKNSFSMLILSCMLTGSCMQKKTCESLKEYTGQLAFENSGTVTKDMVFEKRVIQGFYVETDSLFTTIDMDFKNHDYHDYLFQVKDSSETDPPSGMRSSVPLGAMGAGSIELRADGSFKDWLIFNNSPSTGLIKTQLDNAFMGLRVKESEKTPIAKTLRTHPPKKLPAIAQITYAGSFPVSKLEFSDVDIGIQTKLYAYSEFHARQPEASKTPAILFSLELTNATDTPTEVSFLFNLPNYIKGSFGLSEAGLTLTNDDDTHMSGSMTLAGRGADDITYHVSDDIAALWRNFSEEGTFPKPSVTEGDYGAIAAKASLDPKEVRTITLMLTWYFPNKPIAYEDVGNYYTNYYRNSDDVATKTLNRLPEIWDGILDWNNSCFNNTLPKWLQDSMVNSMGTMTKTGIWTKDGRWRQWESYACPNIDPIHIHFARSLPYELFFPSFKKSIISALGRAQRANGYIPEKLFDRTKKSGGLDNPPPGRKLGDCNTAFILSVYMTHKWGHDSDFVDAMWPHVKRAIQWQIDRSKQFGVPERLASTYDLSAFGEKDIVSYNVFMHMAALKATGSMATYYGDEQLAKECENSFDIAVSTMEKYLWEGTYFRNWWSKDQPVSDDLHIDTQFGQLWSYLLGLGDLMDPYLMLSHLEREKEVADSPFGLKVLAFADADRDETGSGVNHTVWQASSIHWSILNMYLDGGEGNMQQAKKLINHWRTKLNDQWNYADLTHVSDGYPHTNSHYGRQLMLWGLPMALVGQQYDAVQATLDIAPNVKAPYKLPIFTPSATGVVVAEIGKPLQFELLSGELTLKTITFRGEVVAEDLSLKQGEKKLLNKRITQFDR